ncbi:putative leader peptide [Nonomuraea sp. NPDC046570]
MEYVWVCGVLNGAVRFSLTVVLLVERLHIDLCRLTGCLCR